MHSRSSLASKASLFLCVLACFVGILAQPPAPKKQTLSCPPPGAENAKFTHSACTIDPNRNTKASFPGAPNLDGAFNCGDKNVKTPLCCDTIVSQSKVKANRDLPPTDPKMGRCTTKTAIGKNPNADPTNRKNT
ncbi:hypothetical protein PGT21_001944 [Puccinia graminis f. sp. tritici]|uniref:Hydrophobin n=2 Tax=Puccinia graminis f. sp. tritici TaxID=56615 RepID=E3JVE0_PUCGT|nr:uncharacterized protein PGTG_01346 [Puccinia graminis f. sp. tritici CRL 75-36-700-3]KAA1069999.1 hypothetical protein PGTUg99_001335 [Puccinia graminis f. sp. tritici]EFP76015.2 hypothetical protein PGTG_01346 [Puccinia graminis f. sp. tritici CRL 75-36-700-3]KAA1071277.1 hypothetical protein PGT21_002062 [Puccinia graminis f. sp. tritici]KAA1077282.1 hypothetical protein PGT21_001944 [Puccinia graminis f. sp. tritici]KAA1137459.1 hypothetical protein PGTUg99_016477 [Puccinia graminis f. s